MAPGRTPIARAAVADPVRKRRKLAARRVPRYMVEATPVSDEGLDRRATTWRRPSADARSHGSTDDDGGTGQPTGVPVSGGRSVDRRLRGTEAPRRVRLDD